MSIKDSKFDSGSKNPLKEKTEVNSFRHIPAAIVPLKLANAHAYKRKISQNCDVKKIKKQAKDVNAKSSASNKHVVTVKQTDTHVFWFEHSKNPIGPLKQKKWEY